jgi:hypothetical protein
MRTYNITWTGFRSKPGYVQMEARNASSAIQKTLRLFRPWGGFIGVAEPAVIEIRIERIVKEAK